MPADSFDDLVVLYDVDLAPVQYDGQEAIGVGFDGYSVACSQERTLTGDHRVLTVENMERLDPVYGEFGDEYTRTVLRDLNGFTDLDSYLARHEIYVEGVNDDLYSRIRGRASRLLSER